MPMPRVVAKLNRAGPNKLTALWAGRMPGQCIVLHIGRRSGRPYRTPVWFITDGDSVRFSLTYGPGSDWARNVVAAGGCTVQHRGRRIDLVDPALHRDPTMIWAPAPVRPLLRLLDAPDYLQCRRH